MAKWLTSLTNAMIIPSWLLHFSIQSAAVLNGSEVAMTQSEWVKETLAIQKQPVFVSSDLLQNYAGRYDERLMTYREEILYYHRDGGAEHMLIPISQDRFTLSGFDIFRVQFVIHGRGSAEKLSEYIAMDDVISR